MAEISNIAFAPNAHHDFVTTTDTVLWLWLWLWLWPRPETDPRHDMIRLVHLLRNRAKRPVTSLQVRKRGKGVNQSHLFPLSSYFSFSSPFITVRLAALA